MDLLPLCRAFVAVAERGSFTRGAAAAGMSQPVASRRIAALERHVGGLLLDRSARRPSPTPLGRRLLPGARRLIAAADAFELDAEDGRLDALHLAVPDGWDARDAAAVEIAGADHGLRLVLVPTAPGERAAALTEHRAGAAVMPAAADLAHWTCPLGLAGALAGDDVAHLHALRPSRGRQDAPRVWLLPEDDVPAVRDPLAAAVDAAGLRPRQLVVAASAGAALAAALTSRDVVVAGRADAARWQLAWSPLAHPALVRAHALITDGSRTVSALLPALAEPIAHALGATAASR